MAAVQVELPRSQTQPYTRHSVLVRLEHIKAFVSDRFPPVPSKEKHIIIEDSWRQITG